MFKYKKLTSGCLTTTLLASFLSFSPPSTAQERLDNLITNLCQTSIQVKLAANRGRESVNMNFETVERSPLSGGEQSIQGQARVQMRNSERVLTYNCIINVTDGLITQSSYAFNEIEASSPRLCQEALRQGVQEDRDGTVEFNQDLETYPISSVEEGVRGTALIESTREPTQTYRFDCIVNLRQGEVTRISYRPDSSISDRPTVDTQQIVRLCQDNLRQRISSNQIDIGGIIGINLGTGRRIEFREPTNTFYISDNQQGVSGSAILVEGVQERQVDYECTVNIQQNQVTNATLQ